MSPGLDPHRLIETAMVPAIVQPGDDLVRTVPVREIHWRCRCGERGVAHGDEQARTDHGRHAAEATVDDLYRCMSCGERTTPETLDALDGVCHDCNLADACDA